MFTLIISTSQPPPALSGRPPPLPDRRPPSPGGSAHTADAFRRLPSARPLRPCASRAAPCPMAPPCGSSDLLNVFPLLGVVGSQPPVCLSAASCNTGPAHTPAFLRNTSLFLSVRAIPLRRLHSRRSEASLLCLSLLLSRSLSHRLLSTTSLAVSRALGARAAFSLPLLATVPPSALLREPRLFAAPGSCEASGFFFFPWSRFSFLPSLLPPLGHENGSAARRPRVSAAAAAAAVCTTGSERQRLERCASQAEKAQQRPHPAPDEQLHVLCKRVPPKAPGASLLWGGGGELFLQKGKGLMAVDVSVLSCCVLSSFSSPLAFSLLRG